MKLKEAFPSGKEYGNGIVCAPSPFSATFVLDFYDGPTEGFSRIVGTNYTLYFKRVWWDERQNNRLFEGWVFDANDLKRLDKALFEFIQQGFATSISERRAANAEEPLPLNFIEFIKALAPAFRVHIFCLQITREIFVLPVAD